MNVNGKLVFDASGNSEIQNLRIQKLTGSLYSDLPTFGSSDVGRLVYLTGSQVLYVGGATNWIAIATGGNAAALQTEVDAIETSIGPVVNAAGVFQVGQVTGLPFTGTEANLTQLLQALANYAVGNNTIAELDDVGLTGLSTGQYLKYNATATNSIGGTGAWVNETLLLGDVTDVTATTAEVNKLHGMTASTTELNYVTGVTSPIQTQLNALQAGDTGLNSLAAMTSNGIVVSTNNGDTFVSRALVAPSAGITIANPNGVAGAPTFALANDLAAYEGLATTGYVVRTGDGTATTRTIAGTAGNTVVVNGSGVVSDTSIDLAPVTQGTSGTFLKFAFDGFGRVTGNTAVTTSDITALVDNTYVNVTGDSMSGNLTFTGGSTVTGLPTPVNGTDAAPKAYVDSAVAGLSWKTAVKAASTGNLSLTGTGPVDGVTIVAGDRVLVKDQTTASQNGIYVVAAGAWTRSTDMNIASEFEGSAVLVKEGSQADNGFTQVNAVTTVGTDAVHFNQFTGASVLTAGTGLQQVGNVLSVQLGAGIGQLPTAEVGVDLYSVATSALILTDNGTARATTDTAQLALLTGGASGLAQSAAGLFIAPTGVTNAMLLHAGVTTNGDAGTAALNLGGALQVIGTSAAGISTAVTGTGDNTTITITAANASSSQKGVATFNTGDFLVTGGDVTIKLAGVDNNQLAFSTIGYAGDTGGAQTVALGSSFTVVGTAAQGVSTVSSAGSVAITVANATASAKGVASFSATDFAVTAGAVALVPKGISSLTDVASSSPAAGQALVYDSVAAKYENKKFYFLYTGASASTHSVAHNIGQKYCNVTVVDGSDNVVIPESIVYTDANNLVVTFNTAIACKVVVMGVAVV